MFTVGMVLSCDPKKVPKECGIWEALRGQLPPPQAPSPMSPSRTHRLINIKDIRLFTNSITKAVKLIQSAGVKADYNQQEDDNCIYYQITVPKMKV